MLSEKLNGDVSYGELCQADKLIADEEVEERYGATYFVDEYFDL